MLKNSENKNFINTLLIKNEDKRSEEDLDHIYRRRASNSIKSMLPTCILNVLSENSNPCKRLSVREIYILTENKYELDISIKTVRRYLYTMLEEDMKIYADKDKSNFWYDAQGPEKIAESKLKTSVNSQKSLLPVYIINVLRDNSDLDHRLNPRQITELVIKEYDLEVDIKSIRRHLHTLAPANLGVWSDEEQKEFWYSEKLPDWWDE